MPAGDQELRGRLHQLFLEEVDEQVGRIEQGLDVLASSLPEAPPDAVDELFRSAHSLKGAAQAVGATPVAIQCHHLEDGLARVREASLDLDEQLLGSWVEAVRTIRGLAAELRQRDGSASGDGGGDAVTGGHSVPAPAAAGLGPPGSAVARTPPADPEGGAVRVDRRKFDALIARAGELITSSFGAELLVTQLDAATTRLSRELDQWRQERAGLGRMVGDGGVDARDLREALDQIDARFQTVSKDLHGLARSAGEHQRSLRGLTTSFADAARRARTVPFSEATSGLPWLVRDLAGEMGKSARILVSDADVEVDKELVARLHDALRHLVRNAVDHGLEQSAVRAAAGKPTTGTVEITAELTNDGVEVRVRDDGRGVDLARVREAAAELGLDPDHVVASGTETLFRPGLSTAATVSTVSGRGVGLDAVRSAIEETGGSVSLRSEEGVGTEVRLLIPLTSSTVRAVLVRTAGEVVAVPASPIEQVLRLPADGPHVDGREILKLGERTVPVVALSGLLGWAEPAGQGMPAEERLGLLVSGSEGSVVLTVAGLVTEQEIVLRAAPSRVAGVSVLLGTTQTAEGSVALVLNPSACVRAALALPSTRARPAVDQEETAPRQVLLVEDTMLTRELERSILEGAGYAVTVAVDGRQAWRILQSKLFDVVISDVNMPRMDGIELCRAIRGSRELAGLPILLVTSLHSDGDRRRGLEAGADGYLTKEGFNRDELLSAVERLL